jgi:Fe-S cluster biosynthesis and repair protein YggX
MAVADERIEQFRKMTEADPANELAHFSLGRALLEADRVGEAATSFQRTIEINPQMSPAYHLLAQAQAREGNREGAVATLRRGLVVAQKRGDLAPAKAMGQMLEELGAGIPEAAEASPAPRGGRGPGGFQCRRCGGGEPMAEAPMRGELGQQIRESICADCWREWLRMGTKVINELRLDFRDADAQATYDRHMKEFLGL